MIQIGVFQPLEIARVTQVGLFLTDGTNDVLLPNKYVPESFEIGDILDVFVYLDHEERPVATTLKPYVTLSNFAFLRVNYINKFGAFLDWGLEKDLFVPFKEQARPMEEGKRYLVYVYLDNQSQRLVASSKLNQFLDNDNLTILEGDKVLLMISHTTDLGVNVIINGKHKGLVYQNEIFEISLRPGDLREGYIKAIRTDGKIDVSFQPLGYDNITLNAQKILDILYKSKGFLRLSDHSSPDDIKTVLQMSKKTFKKAVGNLYKEQKIEIKPEGIFLKN
jgi:uncharacterized protein